MLMVEHVRVSLPYESVSIVQTNKKQVEQLGVAVEIVAVNG